MVDKRKRNQKQCKTEFYGNILKYGADGLVEKVNDDQVNKKPQ